MRQGTILSNCNLQGEYFEVRFFAPELCASAQAGQFVHVQINEGLERILRRPFSIHNCDLSTGALSVVYKVVGAGTKELSGKVQGDCCDLLGPLGNSYSQVGTDEFPVIVDGGYGSAATYLLARHSPVKGVLLLGARSSQDIILADRYQALGFDVRIATNDGSLGRKGFVTDLLPELLTETCGRKLKFFACGPHPMLMALTKLLHAQKLPGEISLDHLMCCGVGSCFACVVKTKADTPEGWEYARSCKDGPVFDVEKVYT